MHPDHIYFPIFAGLSYLPCDTPKRNKLPSLIYVAHILTKAYIVKLPVASPLRKTEPLTYNTLHLQKETISATF